jgi:DNA-binding MarR family transcriptional regulator
VSSVRSTAGRELRLAYLIKWVERGLRLRLDHALSECGVTTPEYTALSVLREREGLSSAQLARRVFVTPQAMNQIVIELERRGLIRRKISETHGRTLNTSLTAVGAALLVRCDRATLVIEERLLEGLSKSDAAALRRTLSLCADALIDRPATGDRRGERASGTPRKDTGADVHGR